jgi:hypothetical protein
MEQANCADIAGSQPANEPQELGDHELCISYHTLEEIDVDPD